MPSARAGCALPIGMRLAGLALAAMAALLFGWRERGRRRAFALAVQGGAIGVLLMTVFGAFRLYHLLPAGVSFALMLVLVAATCWLALLQDSIALAVLAILAGFAAPMLPPPAGQPHLPCSRTTRCSTSPSSRSRGAARGAC